MYIVSTTNRQTKQKSEFDLPLAERELDRQLTSAGYESLHDVSIDSIESHDGGIPLPDELRQADIFELNYLFSSLARFSEYDLDDFYAVVSLKDLKTAKEFINTALDMENGVYTFCHSAHDHEDLATWYLETEDLCLSNWVEDNLDYDALGRDLDRYEAMSDDSFRNGMIVFTKGVVFSLQEANSMEYSAALPLDYSQLKEITEGFENSDLAMKDMSGYMESGLVRLSFENIYELRDFLDYTDKVIDESAGTVSIEKMRAALELEGCITIDEARHIVDNLDGFDYFP